MQVIKLDGKKQQFLPNKVFKRIKSQSKDLSVDPSLVFQDVVTGMVDQMSTTEIDNLIAVSAASRIIEDPDYSLLASRIIISRQGKLINIQPNECDYSFDFFGARSFLHKYSERDDNELPIELPHMMYERVANYLGCDHLHYRKLYNYLCNKKISLATPILINAGTERKSLISCNITTLAGDDTDSILSMLNDISKSSRDGQGIGLHIHNIRSKHSLVSSFKGKAGGVVRLCDMVQSHMRFFKQGKRSGSAAIYLGAWHRDIEDFLELRLPTGDEKMRTRDLFTAVCFPDLFMEKLNSGDDDWYVFCPNDVKKAGFSKGLHEVWGEDWKKLYNELVDLGIGHKTSVSKLWNMHIKSLAEAGMPYTNYWDNMNRNNPQSNIGIRTGSNLCAEYLSISKGDYTPQCCLGLIPLHNIDKNDFSEIRKRVEVLTIALNRVIDLNVWSTSAAKKAAEEQRTIGIGIAGLADYMAKHKIDFDSDEAKEFNRKMMSTIYDTAKKTSSKLAVEIYGKSYAAWKGSQYEEEGVPMSNSLLTCMMPSASSSVMIGCNEMFEPFQSNIFVRRIDAAEFVVVNKWMVRDLKEINLWNEDIRNTIIQNDGSVQNIDVIPNDIKRRYRTIWEIKQRELIELAAIRQNNGIDQAQSMNLYFSEATTGKIGGALNFAWQLGLPTGSYYTKTRSELSAPKRLSNVIENMPNKPINSDFECFGCSA